MKRVLKIIGIILGVVIIAIAGFVIYINASGIPSYEVDPPEEYIIYTDSASVAEGARMASMMCINCHGSGDRKMGGAYMADAKDFGEIYPPNISSHPDSRLSAYSDEELVYLLRTGIKRDGQFAPPYMPKFPNLSDKDMKSLIGFLRSDHPLMAPTDKEPPMSQPNFLTKFLCNMVIEPLPYPKEEIPHVDTTDVVAWGKYISTAKFDCYQCHSADFKTNNIMYPEKSPGYFAGGNQCYTKDGDLVLSPNLTMDEETGIGNYTEEEFVRVVLSGIRPDGKEAVQYPMIPFTQMTEKEAKAIWAYLQTLEPVKNEKLAQANMVE
ncbi:MAG: c-type cytochrome [Saprospiraceae bacterium]|nr:c-type cytochrome [Saprospiraceae bacterium]